MPIFLDKNCRIDKIQKGVRFWEFFKILKSQPDYYWFEFNPIRILYFDLVFNVFLYADFENISIYVCHQGYVFLSNQKNMKNDQNVMFWLF